MDLMWPTEADTPASIYFPNGTSGENADFFRRHRRFLSADRDTLRLRQELFQDILAVDGLGDFLLLLAEKLAEYAPLMKKPSPADRTEEQLHRMLYPAAYIELVSLIRNRIAPLMGDVSAESIKALFAMAERDAKTPEYVRLAAYYRENTGTQRAVRSVTVGINLDALYRPKEAGIVALHQEEYLSGDLLDRILRLDFTKDDFHCIAPLTAIDSKLGFGESQQINHTFLKAMRRILDGGLSHCGKRLLRYADEKLTPYFALQDSLAFLTDAIRHLDCLKKAGIPLCFPTVSPNGSARIRSLYDDTLARRLGRKNTVPNHVAFGDGVCCHLLTGPNSGGKTVFLRALAAAQCYFQLGMPIPAEEATLPLFTKILQVKAEAGAAADIVGRFEGECRMLAEVMEQFDEGSLLLLDEAFTATSAGEALPVAANFIARLCARGGKCLFVTHLHGLEEVLHAAGVPEAQIGWLRADTADGSRSYRIRPGKAAPHSGAREIARKYGLLE